MFNRKKAFTLTEVIVVIVIIAALAIILIPNMLSLMPDDHNIKYKKAFYTIQEVVNDIANECQGMYYNGGNWYSVEEWNSDPAHDSNRLADADENVLSFCYNSSGTALNPKEEICKRLSTVEDCPSNDAASYQFKTTNGVKWKIDTSGNAVTLGSGKSWGSTGNILNIFVNLDNQDIVNTDTWAKQHERGTYLINVHSNGKVVIPSGSDFNDERNYLLKNPTED